MIAKQIIRSVLLIIVLGSLAVWGNREYQESRASAANAAKPVPAENPPVVAGTQVVMTYFISGSRCENCKTIESLARETAEKDFAAEFATGRVVLGYEDRFLRRKRLVMASGDAFLVDLAETTNLLAGDAFELDDGRLVEIAAAEEPVLVIKGDLVRLAWHIGNRHTPCQIEADRLVIRADHVLADMLRGLGATVTETQGPFTPEGGAYGLGRTMGHAH